MCLTVPLVKETRTQACRLTGHCLTSMFLWSVPTSAHRQEAGISVPPTYEVPT